MIALLRRLRALVHRGRIDRELAEEMRIHLDMAADDAARDGLPADEAEYAARRRFGNPARIKEDAVGIWLRPLPVRSPSDLVVLEQTTASGDAELAPQG